jgi:hypothetical protein
MEKSPFDFTPEGLPDFLKDAFKSPQPTTRADREARAKELGYRVDGSNAIGRFQGKRLTTPLSQLMGPTTGGGELGGMPAALKGAFLSDTARMQQELDSQFERNQQEIDGFRSFLGGMSGDVRSVFGKGADELGALAGEVKKGVDDGKAFEDQLAGTEAQAEKGAKGYKQGLDKVSKEVDKNVEGRLQSADRDIERAYRISDQAESEYRKSIAEYEDRGAQDASAVAHGIRRNAHTAMMQVRSGVRADGVPMTPEEQDAAATQIKVETEAQVQMSIAPLMTRFNEVRASMKANLAGLTQGRASTRLQGASLKQAGARMGLEAATLKSGLEKEKFGADQYVTGVKQTNEQFRLAKEESRRESYKLAASLTEASANMRNAGLLNSVNLEMQGRTSLAQMVQMNPRNVVSLFQGLLAMYSINRAGSSSNFGMGGMR